MRVDEIKVGHYYEGGGAVYFREVDHIFRGSEGRIFVHWFSQFAAKTPSGRTFHTPNRTCLLSTFRKWAQKDVTGGERNV